jgi:gliding motility-associated-like protein
LDENGNWVSTGNSVNTQYNCGGYKNKLYSISYQNQITEVNRFNGQSYTAIYSSAKPVVCADIAVDEKGNFFLLTATSPGAMSDTLYLISENGTVLKKYALELNSNHIYGSFYFDHTLYLGIGKNNNEHPNSLIPISFMGNTALIQPQLALPSGIVLEYDLAACQKTVGTLLADSSSLVYPNIFSPNMDGSNDIFVAIEKNISQLNCKIYNRYGILVSELKEVKSAWDGRSISGMELPAGVYYYIATGRGTDEKEYDLSGFVHLVR